MTTAKSIRLLALLLCAVCLFSACASSSPSPDLYDLGQTPSNSERHQDPFASHLYVIIPASAEPALVEKAQALVSGLIQYTEISTDLFYDNQSFVAREDAGYVLLGYTSYPASRQALLSLKRDDYLCCWDPEARTLILGGKKDSATVAAIDRFSQTILPYADKAVLMSNTADFEVRAEYAVPELLLCGHSLGSYNIVYPDNPQKEELTIAHALREALADRCGFYPDLIALSKVTSFERLIILSGEAPASVPAQISCVGTTITLSASSAYGLGEAAEAFVERVLPSAVAGNHSVTLPALTKLSVSLHELDMFSLPLPQGLPAAPDSVGAVDAGVTALKNSGAAIGLSDGISADLQTVLSAAASDYTLVVPESAQENVPTLFYDADKLSLLSSDTVCNSDGAVVRAYRFSCVDSSFTFTLLHAYIESGRDASALQNILTLSEDVPTVLFAYMPTENSLTACDTATLWRTHSLSSDRQLTFAYFANGSSASVTSTDTSIPAYTLSLSHSFWISQ